MANPDAPFGFREYNHGGGGTPGRLEELRIATDYGTAIGFGDIVKTDGDGNVALATAGDAMIGVFKGCRYTAPDGSIIFKKNWVASTATQSGSVIYALVNTDPSIFLEAQSDGSMTRADVGQLCNLVAGTVNATTGMSTMQTSATGGSESQFVVVDVIEGKPVRGSDGYQTLLATGTNARVVVKPAKHERGGAATAVEV